MPPKVRRVIKVKSCNSTKNQECFAAKRGSRVSKRRVSKRRVSKRRVSKRRVSKRRVFKRRLSGRRSSSKRRVNRRSSSKRSRRSTRRISPKRSRRSTRRISPKRSRRVSRKHNSHKGLVLSKSADIISQIKNFFKIDQEIIYIVQHPRKAKRNNVLKLLGAIIIILMLVCRILKMTGSSYNCDQLINKLNEITESVKNGSMSPLSAVELLRVKLAELWVNIKNFGPFVSAINFLSGTKGKVGNMARSVSGLFTKPIEKVSENVGSVKKLYSTEELAKGVHTVKDISEHLDKVRLTLFNTMRTNNGWKDDYTPTRYNLGVLAGEKLD